MHSVPLSMSMLEEVPENAQELPVVTCLDLTNNKIKIYTNLITYPLLTELNLAHNALAGSLHVEIFARLKCLKTLDVSHNRLVSVAAVEMVRDSLVALNVSHNRLRRLAGVDACYNLNSLNVAGNLLAKDAKDCGLAALESLHKLRNLDFRGNLVLETEGIMPEIKSLLPYVTRLNGRELRPLVSPRVGGDFRASSVFMDASPKEAERKEPKVNLQLELFRRSLEEAIARKERLLRKLPVVF